MALPDRPDSLSMTQIAKELGIVVGGGKSLSLGDPRVRVLGDKPSGTIAYSDLRGKSAGVRFKFINTLGVADTRYDYQCKQDVTLRGIGYGDRASSSKTHGKTIGRPVSGSKVQGTLRDKNGRSHTVDLFYFVPQRSVVIKRLGGGGIGGGDPRSARQSCPADGTYHQLIYFSIRRSDRGSMRGNEFKFSSCKVTLKDGGNVIASSTKTNPLNNPVDQNGRPLGDGTFINLHMGGITTTGAPVDFYNALIGRSGKTIELILDFK